MQSHKKGSRYIDIWYEFKITEPQWFNKTHYRSNISKRKCSYHICRNKTPELMQYWETTCGTLSVDHWVFKHPARNIVPYFPHRIQLYWVFTMHSVAISAHRDSSDRSRKQTLAEIKVWPNLSPVESCLPVILAVYNEKDIYCQNDSMKLIFCSSFAVQPVS